jgi:hypothetical protein
LIKARETQRRYFSLRWPKARARSQLMDFLKKFILYSRDILAVIFLVVFYHGYELLCFMAGNIFHYHEAVAICAGVLFLVSLGLIYLHDFFKDRFAWDALRLQYLNSLSENEKILAYQIFRRLTRVILREGFWAVFVLGPIVLGPFITTVLLRKRKTWQVNVLYAGSGALFSALFWVAIMRGLGVFTWRYFSALEGLTR